MSEQESAYVYEDRKRRQTARNIQTDRLYTPWILFTEGIKTHGMKYSWTESLIM